MDNAEQRAADRALMRELGEGIGHTPRPIDEIPDDPARPVVVTDVVCFECDERWPCPTLIRAWFLEMFTKRMRHELGYSAVDATLLAIGFASGWDARDARPDA